MKQATVKKLYPYIAVIAFIIMMMFSFSFRYTPKGQAINPIIGDVSFMEKFGYMPDVTTNEDLRISTHLAYVEKLLRQKDVSNLSPELQNRRKHLLDLLNNYWTNGIFPRNYDHGNRRPCFIDKDGRICAVGYLVEQTAGRQVAEDINLRYKYEYVSAMNDKSVDSWIKNSGLTKEECAIIQPQYPQWCTCTNQFILNAICVQRGKHYACKKINRLALKGAVLSGEETAFNTYTNRVANSTTVSILLKQPEKISLNAYDMNGRLIARIADASFGKGSHEISWDTKALDPGMYLLKAQFNESVERVKLFLVN